MPATSGYLALGLVLVGITSIPWKDLITLSLGDDQYTHLVLVPLIAGALIHFERNRIFRERTSSPRAGMLTALAGLVLNEFDIIVPAFSGSHYHQAVSTLGGIVILVASFLLYFGLGTFYRAAFALSLLLLIVPAPKPVMNLLVRALQNGSAAFSAILFKLIHLPALRQNLTFSLPGFDIEIAEQCSGIRSSIALCIASTLAGHLFLMAWWRKVLLVLITIPLVIFKNAVRIVTISSLGVYVSQGFLHGTLHRYSGLPFSLVELAVVAPLLIKWHRLETRRIGPPGQAH